MTYILRTHMKKKYLLHGLRSVYGLGKFSSDQICKRLGFQKMFMLRNISDEQIFNLSQCVEELSIPLKGDLQRWVKLKIDKLISLRVYRGIRHRQGLPVRGQRTHTNARTQKKLKYLKKF